MNEIERLQNLLRQAYNVMDEVRASCRERANMLKGESHYETWAMELADMQRTIREGFPEVTQ